jgi:hypothetical protein
MRDPIIAGSEPSAWRWHCELRAIGYEAWPVAGAEGCRSAGAIDTVRGCRFRLSCYYVGMDGFASN